jgi:hypothetical protein
VTTLDVPHPASTHDTDRPAPAPQAHSDAARWSGDVAAALISAGLGSTAFGLAVVFAEHSRSVKAALTLHDGAGPLSGKAAAGTAVFLLAWVLLHIALRTRTVPARLTTWLTLTTLALGLLLTFPPLYQLAGH